MNSGMRVMSPLKFHSVSGGPRRISGCRTGTQRPPPIGSALFFVASIRNSSFICASFSGILAARSLAWDQSSVRW